MSGVYDNWSWLVKAVLKREELRQIALCESLSSSSSISADFSSRLSFDSSLEDEAVGNSSTGAIAEGLTAAVGNSSTRAIAGRAVARVARLFAAPAVAFARYRRRKQRDYFFDVSAGMEPVVRMGQLKRFSLHELEAATDNCWGSISCGGPHPL